MIILHTNLKKVPINCKLSFPPGVCVNRYRRYGYRTLHTSVVDPWHFGSDPGPRKRTTDFRIRLLPFSSVNDKMPAKNNCQQIFCLLVFEVSFTLVFLSIKSKKKSQNIINQGFSYFFACWWKDLDPYKIMTDPDLEGPKTSGSTTLRHTNIFFLHHYLVYYLWLMKLRPLHEKRLQDNLLLIFSAVFIVSPPLSDFHRNQPYVISGSVDQTVKVSSVN